MEAVENDGKFFLQNDVGEYKSVVLNDFLISKNNSQANVSLDTGEMKTIKIEELFN